MGVERPLDFLAVGTRINPQPVLNVDALDHQDAVIRLDLTGRLACESAFACGDLTRLQRASERSGQSAGRRRDHVVERRRSLGVAAPCDAVVVGHGVVHPELDRLVARGQPGSPERPANPLDADARRVCDLAHAPESIALRSAPYTEEEP